MAGGRQSKVAADLVAWAAAKQRAERQAEVERFIGVGMRFRFELL